VKHLVNCPDSLKIAVDFLSNEHILSLDTETTGLFPWHGDRLFSVQFGSKLDEFYFDFSAVGLSKKFLTKLAPILNRPTAFFYFVNAIFDASMLYVDGLNIQGHLVDAAALARVENNVHPENNLSADYLAAYYIGGKKDTTVKDYIKKNNLYKTCHVTRDPKKKDFTRVPLDIMFPYGCSDVRITYDLTSKIIERINYKDANYSTSRPVDTPLLMDIVKNEIRLTKTLFNMKKNGMLVDTKYVLRAFRKEITNHKLLTNEITKIIGRPLNANSPKQKAEYILGQGYRLPVKPPTVLDIKKSVKTGIPIKPRYKTDADTLEALNKKHNIPVLKKLIGSAQSKKKANTYYRNFYRLKDKDNILHCNLNQDVPITGRLSSSQPNLQNLTKEDYHEWAVRNSLISFPNETLYFFDWAQQEMMIMLDRAGEMSVINKIKSGEFTDFYLATAQAILETTGIIISRAVAKEIALSLAYGKGIKALSVALGISILKAKEFYRAFFNGLPKFAEFKLFLENQIRYFGKIHNAFGRVQYLYYNDKYKVMNSYVQSTAADVCKIALNKIDILLENKKSKLRLVVHDENIVGIRHGEEKYLVPKIIEIMENAYPSLHVGIKVDVESSRGSWAEKRKV